MPPFNKKQKKVEDLRSPTQIAIDSARTSGYNLCTPMRNAEYIRLRNPVTRLDKVYSVSDPSFLKDFRDLAELNLRNKLMSEIQSFAQNIDPRWSNVYANLERYLKADEVGDINEN